MNSASRCGRSDSSTTLSSPKTSGVVISDLIQFHAGVTPNCRGTSPKSHHFGDAPTRRRSPTAASGVDYVNRGRTLHVGRRPQLTPESIAPAIDFAERVDPARMRKTCADGDQIQPRAHACG